MRDKDTFCVSTQVGCRFGCAFCATGRMGFKRNLTPAEILGQVLFLRSASERDGQLVPREPAGGAAPEDNDSDNRDTYEAGPNQPESAEGDSAEETSQVTREESSLTPTSSKIPPPGARSVDADPGAPATASRGFNVVFMGMGEPLDNYENTVKAIRIMQHPDGLAVGGRRITVSTCGIPDKIKRLAREDLGVGLALSLNATTDELRAKLVPAGKVFRLKQVLEAVRYFAEKSGRRITLEYVLIAGVNDRPSDAKRLISIASSVPCKINLIALNSSPGVRLQPPSDQAIQRMVELLYPRAPAVTLRKSKGSDIMAACGQLRTDIVREKAGTDRRPTRKAPSRTPRRARPQKRRPGPAPDERRGRARAEREDARRRAGSQRRPRRAPTDAGRRKATTGRPWRRDAEGATPRGPGRRRAGTERRGDTQRPTRRAPTDAGRRKATTGRPQRTGGPRQAGKGPPRGRAPRRTDGTPRRTQRRPTSRPTRPDAPRGTRAPSQTRRPQTGRTSRTDTPRRSRAPTRTSRTDAPRRSRAPTQKRPAGRGRQKKPTSTRRRRSP
jgi:adenine C2-methylase RlmN of 23S rRNA A2503 and tRNA A37